MQLENWVKVREFDDLEWARRNRIWVRDDQMPTLLLRSGQVIDDPDGPNASGPWSEAAGDAPEGPAAYELWVQRRDEVRAGHILNMHHKVVFEVHPTPTGARFAVIFLMVAFWIGIMPGTAYMTQFAPARTLGFAAAYAWILTGIYLAISKKLK